MKSLISKRILLSITFLLASAHPAFSHEIECLGTDIESGDEYEFSFSIQGNSAVLDLEGSKSTLPFEERIDGKTIFYETEDDSFIRLSIDGKNVLLEYAVYDLETSDWDDITNEVGATRIEATCR